MLRVKITLVYLVLVGLLVGLVSLLLHATVSDALRDDADVAVRRAANAAVGMKRLDDAALMAKAEFMARGDRLYRSLKGEFVQPAGEGEGEGPVDFAGQRHLDSHEKLTAQKYRLEEAAKAPPQIAGLLSRAPVEPDMVMVLDDEAVGVAALGKDLYSWFGEDIGAQFPDLQKVAGGAPARLDYWMWSFKPGDEKRLYRVAIVPVRRTEDEQPAGILVLGNMITDGMAARAQAIAAGAAEREGEGDEADAEAHLEAAPEVLFYRGADVVASTFASNEQTVAAGALTEAGILGQGDEDLVREVTIGEETFLVARRFARRGEDGVGILTLASVEDALAPLRALRINVLIIGVLAWLIGTALLFFLVVRHLKPIEDLETGIQEVIAGNKDYRWDPIEGHDLQASLASNLNLMSAYLQGKPMPDDDDAGGNWGDLMPGGGAASKTTAPGKVQGVDLSALSAPPPPSDD